MTRLQEVSLVVLRTLIGWHFAYEGLYKLRLPGWLRSGQVAGSWSAQGYLRGATGPFAPAFHRLAAHAVTMQVVDLLVPIGLLLVGLSLMLGLLTQVGCAAGALFLALFYLSAPPFSGMPQTGAEGTYLFVNKNLIELAALLMLMAFRTGAMAGLDRLFMPPAPPDTDLSRHAERSGYLDRGGHLPGR
jgi:thiosulfate dehydrogenase (quinone) large subunit